MISLTARGRRCPDGTNSLRPAGRRRFDLEPLVMIGLTALLALLPLVSLTIPGLLPGPVSSPGSLQVLAICLVFVSMAMSYDAMFGYAGLFSFGHALFFGVGIYGTNLAMDHLGLPFVAAALLACVTGVIIAGLVGAAALQVRGIAFSMVTLAFVEALSIILYVDPFDFTGGENGLSLARAHIPTAWLTVLGTKHVYWLALGFAALSYFLLREMTRSKAGRVWEAIRENEDRVGMLGIRAFPSKLLVFVLGSSFATGAGAIYLVILRGAYPNNVTSTFSLSVVFMVILGGAGRLWGAAIGGMIYGLATLRLPALGESAAFDWMPSKVHAVVAEPLFILGVLFVLAVLFLPKGAAGAIDRASPAARRRRVTQGEDVT